MSEESRGGNTKWKRTARGSKVVTMADNSSADSADPESEEPVASGKGRKKKSSNSHRKLSLVF